MGKRVQGRHGETQCQWRRHGAGETLFAVYGQEKAIQPEPAKDTPRFTIARLVVGTGIENREPVGVAEKFPSATEKVYCYLEATGIAKDTEIYFVWLYNQEEMLKTGLTLKADPKWRTNANKSLRGLKGNWKVEVRDDAGKSLKGVNFKVE